MENTTQIYTAAVLEGVAEVIEKAWESFASHMGHPDGGVPQLSDLQNTWPKKPWIRCRDSPTI